MTVAPLIAMKSTKCESLEAVGKELDRRAHTYANDVDQSGRHIGYICRAGDESPVPLEQAIVEEVREAVRRAEMAIAGLTRRLGPRSARMTTKALKRDLAALEKDMSPVTLASEARDAARAPNARRGNVPQRDCGQSR